MSVDVKPSCVFLCIDCIINMLECDKAKTSRLIALLIIDQAAFL